MGKKGKHSNVKNQPANGDKLKCLSSQKRYELNQLIDGLLKQSFVKPGTISQQWDQYVESQKILNKIKAIESAVAVDDGVGCDRMSKIKEFCDWCRSNNAHFDDIEINEFPDCELGLKATRDFKTTDLLVSIPDEMILSAGNKMVKISEAMCSLPLIQVMDNVRLAFTLLVERLSHNSFWKPYIQILPARYETVMEYTVDEMNQLKGSCAFKSALTQCNSIARQYATAYKFIHTVQSKDNCIEMLKDKFSYNLYCWAVSTVMTRQNALPKLMNPLENKNGEDNSIMSATIPALIPFWDMANHQEGVLSTDYNPLKKRIECSAWKNIKKNEQVYIYYGHRPNCDLLVHNGFVSCLNAEDEVPIQLGFSDADPLKSERLKVLESMGIALTDRLAVRKTPKFFTSKLLVFCRVFNMDEKQLAECLSDNSQTMQWNGKIRDDLDRKTLKFLEIRLTILLRGFPTSLSQDSNKLKDVESNKIHLNSVQIKILKMLILEKEILSNAITELQNILSE